MPRASKKSVRTKEEFFKMYSAEILMRSPAKFYHAHIKVEIDGVECDYYPGAQQKIDRTKYGRLNRIDGGTNNWSDLDHKDFLSLLKIEVLS